MKLTDNFFLNEFDSKDGAEMPCEIKMNVMALAVYLQQLRYRLDKPVVVTSGYRSPEWNKRIGGVPNSQHVTGKAADFRVPGMEPRAVAKVLNELIAEKRIPEGGIGIYKTFVHYDYRGTKARW